MTEYRYEWEMPILLLTFAVALGLGILLAILSQCVIPLMGLGMILFSYLNMRGYYNQVKAMGIPLASFPVLLRLYNQSQHRLEAPEVAVVLMQSDVANAYTFGLHSPNVMVINTRLAEILDDDEMRFVIGHELAHVQLGHTWLNTILGNLGGLPGNFIGTIIYLLTLTWWNRACELSCDRAGLLACGNLSKSITALIKLTANDARTVAQLNEAYDALDREDDTFLGSISDSLSQHPLIIKRINQLKAFSQTEKYASLNARAHNNLPLAG